MNNFTILKKSILVALFTAISVISFAADLYWVGGTGNWTDVSHWSIASGGAGGSGSIPTSSDNVFFDANSFTGAGQSVTITASASCLSMNWTGATNNPTFDVANSPINIYGSLVLISNMNLMATNSYYFKSTTTGNTITTAGKTIPHHFYFDGVGGSWTLLDNLTFGPNGIIYLQNGTLNTNGQTVTIVQFSSNNTNVRHLSMGSSVFNVSSGVPWDVQGANFTSDAGTSVVNLSDGSSLYFRGGTGNYNIVNFTNTTASYPSTEGSGLINEVNYYGTGRVYYSGTIQKVHFYKSGLLGSSVIIDTVLCDPGTTLQIVSGTTLTTKKFFSNGSCDLPINIEAAPNSSSATITSNSTSINFQYTHFKGISATGSATFTANNSIDLGNTSGITINQAPSQNLYWVGGTGNFNDAAHWSLTSGGAGGACVPTRLDNVFFDGASFNSGGQTVTINAASECNSMNWTGAINNPTLAGSSQLEIYGSLTFVSAMNLSFTGSTYFKSTSPTTTITSAGKIFGNHVYFDGVDGEWTLQDAFATGANCHIYLTKGFLITNNMPLTCYYFESSNSNSRGLSLGSSIITITGIDASYRVWYTGGSNFFIDAGTSQIRFTFVLNGGTIAFYGGAGNYFYDLLFQDPTTTGNIQAGTGFHNVTFNGNGQIDGASGNYNLMTVAKNMSLSGATNTFGKGVFMQNASLIGNQCTFDTLQFTGGYTYTLTSGITVNITNQALMTGTCSSPVNIIAASAGTFATMSSTSNISGSYLCLKDIHATGSFVANNSIDLGNNTGWTINAPAAQNLYWRGGTGNWNDPSHWSFTSGGAGGACVPTRYDNVFINASSFSGAPKQLTINVPAYCNSLNFTGVTTGGHSIQGSSDLNIYGPLTLVNNIVMTGYSGKVYFKSNSTGNTITSAGKVFNNDVYFDGVGGAWTLQDAFATTNFVYLNSGTLNTNGKNFTMNKFESATATTRTLNLGSSLVTINGSGTPWQITNSLTLNAGTSRILLSNTGGGLQFYTAGKQYYDLQANSSIALLNQFSTFHNVTFNGNSNIYGQTFNKLSFNGPGPNYISFPNTVDSLYFAPGSTNFFGSGANVNINRVLSADGTAGDLTEFYKEAASGTYSLTVNSCNVCLNYMNIEWCVAMGSAQFYAANSTNSGNNTGWNFAACPAQTLTVGPITGNVNTCINSTNYIYSIPAVSGADSYTWSVPAGATILSGQGTNTIYVSFGSTGGNVSVDVAACGTTGSATKAVTVNPLPSITNISVTPATCSNADGSATATVSGGTPSYYYRWSSGDTLATAPALAAGQYQLLVFDSYGCRATSNATIVASNGPSITLSSSTSPTCPNGTNGALAVSVSGGTTPYTILWSNGISTLANAGISAGPYEVVVTDANECAASLSITLSQPTTFSSNFTISPSACAGSTGSAQANINGGTGAYTYSWSANAASQTTQTASALAAGVYTVTVTDANACPYTAIATVPNTATTLTGSIGSIVAGDCGPNSAGTATMNASGGAGGYLYAWSNGATTADINGVAPGTYYCTVTDASLCSFSESVVIPSNVGNITQAICMVTVDTSTFTNQVIWEKTITNDIQSFKIYRESNIQNVYTNIATVPFNNISEYTDPVANPAIHAWRYKITAVDSCGVETPYSPAHKTIHLAQNLGVGGEINLSWDQYEGFPYFSYYIWRHDPSTGWMPLDTLSTNYTTYTDFVPPSSASRYMIEVRPQNACNSTMKLAGGGKHFDTEGTIVKSKSNIRTNSVVGIKTETTNQLTTIKVYPNPASSIINVDILTSLNLTKTNNEPATISIENMLGQVVYLQQTNEVSNSINIANTPNGIYLIKVKTQTQFFLKKFIITH